MDSKNETEALAKIRQELKELLVNELELNEITVDQIEDDEVLFDEGLGLDSLDAVEIAVLVQRKFGVDMGEVEGRKDTFHSIDTLSRFIFQNKQQDS